MPFPAAAVMISVWLAASYVICSAPRIRKKKWYRAHNLGANGV